MSLFLLCMPAWATAEESIGQVSPTKEASVVQNDSIDQILERMSQANRQLDYQGIFTYEYAGVLKSVKVAHIVRDGVGHEHWFYLNGPRQEVMRSGNLTGCALSANNPVRGLAPPSVGSSEQLRNHYELQLRGEDRIADRSVWILHIVPKDTLRYGYVFAVDQHTGLLLQSLLLDSDKRVLERFQYMTVSYEVEPAVAQGIVNRAGADKASSDCPADSTLADVAQGWQASWLPEGFALTSRGLDKDGMETLLFSDGLSVFSIFFDPNGDKQLPVVQAQRGATVAQMARVEAVGRSYLVSVVGEIPIETAQRVAGFVKYGNE